MSQTFRSLRTDAAAGSCPSCLEGDSKLKVLDYAFERLPIFGLTDALRGTTSEEKSAMFLADDMAGLGATIVEKIDRLNELNQSQTKLLEMFSDRFGLDRAAGRIRNVFL